MPAFTLDNRCPSAPLFLTIMKYIITDSKVHVTHKRDYIEHIKFLQANYHKLVILQNCSDTLWGTQKVHHFGIHKKMRLDKFHVSPLVSCTMPNRKRRHAIWVISYNRVASTLKHFHVRNRCKPTTKTFSNSHKLKKSTKA